MTEQGLAMLDAALVPLASLFLTHLTRRPGLTALS